MKYKFKIGQKVCNEQAGEMTILFRWHGREENFYDVRIKRTSCTWTFAESEIE